jgi:hypothetical protein
MPSVKPVSGDDDRPIAGLHQDLCPKVKPGARGPSTPAEGTLKSAYKVPNILRCSTSSKEVGLQGQVKMVPVKRFVCLNDNYDRPTMRRPYSKSIEITLVSYTHKAFL